MIQYIRQISIFNKIFNLNGNEWSRVGVSWGIRFLYRVGFVIGWTMIVSLFVTRFGISALPYLFIVNAFFAILGTTFYSVILEKFSKEKLMIGTLFLAALVLFSGVYFVDISPKAFFAILLVAEAVFLVQFRILMDGYIEELFTPMESERTFPVIESAETTAAIAGGLVVFLLANHIEIFRFVYLWMTLLFLIAPLILISNSMTTEVEGLEPREAKKKNVFGIFSKLKRELGDFSHVSFIKMLFLIIFVQWFLFNLIEFQYTRAVYQNVSDVLLDVGSSFEHSLAHELAGFTVIFSSFALVVQLFAGSRIIKSLGIVGSMILHPLVTILSVIPMLFSFALPTALLMKNNFTVTSILFTNAYHSSYYAMKDHIREYFREFLEGVVRPMGALFGTALIILLEAIFDFGQLVQVLNVVILVIVGIFFLITYSQQNRYTRVALDELRSKDLHERLNALEILSQRGHKDSCKILISVLLDTEEDVSVRIGALRGLAELEDIDTIESILKVVRSGDKRLIEPALQAILSFRELRKASGKHVYLKYEVLEALKSLYSAKVGSRIRSKVVDLLSNLSSVSTVEFLFAILKSSKGDLRSDVIRALGKYKDESVVEIIRPYLKSTNSNYRINAAISLGNFNVLKLEALEVIYEFLYSRKSNLIAKGLFAVGELKDFSHRDYCKNKLEDKNTRVRMHAALALLKMGDHSGESIIIDILLNPGTKVAIDLNDLLRNMDVRIFVNFDKMIRNIVSEKISNVLKTTNYETLEDMPESDLKKLQWWYTLVERYEEVKLIEKLIKA